MIAVADIKPAADRELTLTRIFDAPRVLVFTAWTDPRHVARWWGPAGFTNPVCVWEARADGAIRIVMRAPDGTDYPMSGVFREIVDPERLVFTAVAEDADGDPLIEAMTTVTFADYQGRTKLTLETCAFGLVAQAIAMLDGMKPGWTQSIDRLEAYMADL